MKCFMIAQEKCDLLIQVTAEYRWPHGQVWLYFLLLSWVFRLFTSEEIFWQIGDSDTTKSQSKLKQHITKKVVNLWGKPCDRYGSMSYSTWNPSRMPNLVTDVGALCFSDPWNGGWTCDIWMIQWHNGKIEQEMIW